MDLSKIDQRFVGVFRDHKFRSIKQKQRKIKIDGRFHSMFTDDRFKLNYEVDKRGRPVRETSSENLKKYYRLSHKEKKRLKAERLQKRQRLSQLLNIDGKEEIDKTQQSTNNSVANEVKKGSSQDINNDDADSSDSASVYSSSEYDSDEDSGPDLARGEGNVESSSEEEEDENIEMNPEASHHWSELDVDAERSDDISSRLALCNMDWERIKAVDLLVLFNCFKPPGGAIHCVTIYPSDYGAKRIAEEYKEGPAELKETNTELLDEKETKKLQVEKLREHQINRLKYYYAVIECDSPNTADAIYKECDGLEYESSSAKLDLRFIPDGVVFEDHPPKDVADQLPDKDLFKPSNFVTTALNQSKVDLTWDETDQKRVAVTMRRFNEEDLANMDMNDFLASSSGEEEEEENEPNKESVARIGVSSKTTDQDQIARYRSLLLGDDDGEDKPDDVHMEITWEPDLIEEKNNLDKNGEDDSNSDVASSGSEDEDHSNVEEQPKTQQSNKRKHKLEDVEDDPKQKAELEMLMMDSEDLKRKHFDIKEILKEQQMSKKKKRKLGKENDEDDFKIDVEDSRFSAMYTSSEFALDPNNPAFRKTQGMKELVKERQNRLRMTEEKESVIEEKSNKVDNDLDINKLVDSIKAKTKRQFSKKKSKFRKPIAK